MARTYRPREVIRLLESLGFEYRWTRGDHARYSTGRYNVTVPLSPKGGVIDRRQLSSIAKQAGYTPKEFRGLMERR